MPKGDPTRLTKVSVSLPFGMGKAVWESDPTGRKAAWSLYIELVTRIAVQELTVDEGSIREALSSLYSLFGSTREILKAAGPNIGSGKNSVGGIAIRVLNQGLRPFLSTWHIRLSEWEGRIAAGTSSIAHEKAWPDAAECRTELESLRGDLTVYADALAKLAGVAK